MLKGGMMNRMSEKDKAILVLKKSGEKFDELSKEIRKLSVELDDVKKAFEYSNTLLKRVLNEEANGGNIHKSCEYYHEETDCCYNYLMGCYTGLAFEVSRHNKCIEEVVKELEGNEPENKKGHS